MKKFYFLLLFFSLFVSENTFAARDRYPSSLGAFTGGATYCQFAAAANLSLTINTATCGAGGTTNIPITVTWYKNAVNSTVGGTVVQTTPSTTATTTYTYLPSTATIGTLYYYVIVSWAAGPNCAAAGSLTTATTQAVVVTTPMTYTSSSVAQYSPMNIDKNCTDVTNPILAFTVTVTGGCSADSITQFNFTTAGSTNAGTDITRARLYYTRQTSGYNAFYFFGSVNNPSGAFTINGSQTLLDGAGTYYFYLCYDISGTATSGDAVNATMNSFVINGTTENNMSPNPTCTGNIGNASCSGTPDMSGPTANLQTINAGSYIIPMDNSHQALWLGRPFNTKAYGLVRALLMQDIPVKWVIKTGKIKDSSDFSASVTQVYPTVGTTGLQYFKSSEFIIDTAYLNKSVYPGEKTAIQVISAFASEWKVAVYKLTSNTTVDVRYTLNHRPKIALFNNGTFQAVQLAMLDSAKVWTTGTDTALSAGAFDGLASCFTFCSEAHWSIGSQATDSATMAPVWQFVQEGGNFLAQCAGIDKYENQQQPNRHFESSRGVSDQNVTKTNFYHNPDMAFSQFQGTVTSRSGTVASFELPTTVIAHPSVWRPEMYKAVSFSNTSGTTDTIVAAGIHLNSPDSTGGNVFYLAGHDYQTNTINGDEVGNITWINGSRMYLNAVFVPANRPTPTPLQAGSNVTICQGQSTTLGGSPTGPPSGSGNTYTWSPATGLNNPNSANPVATPTVTTTYTVFLNSSGCAYTPASVTVTVIPTPATPTAGSNSPLCAGSTLNLTASTVAGATYSWTGPNGFTSSVQNPSISNATVAAAGTYSVTATISGCTGLAGTVTVIINPTPATPTASSNSPVCSGTTLNLTTGTVAGATYSWTGPNTFSSSSQNPSIANVTVAATGTYSISVTVGGCTSAAGTTAVTVNPTPAAPTAGSNSPICAGSALNLTSTTTAGATYSWTGPNTFSSSSQNPTIAAATVAATGTYSVTVTVTGCTSAAGTTSVTVNPIPATPTASSNSPICAGSTLNLTSSTVAGATYSWTGPNTFTSTIQNPSIAAATVAATGTYSVTATIAGCMSAAGTTSVTVTPIPATPTANSNSPICAGTALNLTSTTVAGATYSWTGPNAFSSSSQNPTIASATVAASGTYSVTATIAGCSSAAATTSVTVNPAPAAPTAGSNTPLCAGATLNLTASTIAGATYSWTGPNSFSSSTQNPSIAGATTAASGTYSVTATVAGCPGPAGTTVVVVSPSPAAPTAGSNSPICSGAILSLTASTIAGATYSWTGPNGFISSSQNPSIVGATVLAAGTYSVTATVAGCTGVSGTVTVIVNPTPSAPTASSNSPLCLGNTLNLTSTTTAGATYSWTGPNAFSSSTQNPSIAAVVLADAGTYSVTVTVAGCTSPAGTTVVVVNPPPSAPTAGSNSPVCSASTLNLTASTTAGATYSWTGPNAFSSSTQNPSIAGVIVADAGTYSVTVTVAGCSTSPAGTVTVVVNPPPSAPTAGSNSPVCAGTPINLTASTIAGATYSWTGPNSFTSSSQNPTIFSAVIADAGTYSVTATVPGCSTSPAGTVTVVVNPIPVAPTAGSNSPICAGSTLNLTASTIVGATYSWTGPNGFTSSSQNPSVVGATTAASGTYSVTATVVGCTGSAGTVTVIVNPIPSSPAVSSNSPICSGTTLNLTASTIAGATYSWTGPNAFSSSSQNPSIAGVVVADAGTYSVVATVSGCGSAAGTIVVVVNPTPIAPTAGSNSPICAGSTLNLTASTIPGATYSWTGPSAFSSSSQNPSIAGVTSVNAGTYSVTATSAAGCTGPVGKVTVVINNPAVVNAGSNQTVCANNDSVKLSGTSSTGSAQWSSSGTGTFSPNNTSLAVTYIPSNADTAAHTITITLTSKNNGACPAVTSTLTITITPAPTVNAGPDQTVCANNDNVTLAGAYSVSSGAVWTTSGSGTFSPNATTVNATYIPSNADTTAGKVTLVLTSTGNGLCKVVTDTMKITITHAPVISAGSNQTVCANNDKVFLNGTSSTGSGTWTSSGTGAFTPNANTLNATYTPSAADVTAGSVTLTLTSGANGTCTAVNGTIIITITPPPTANAGPDQTVCGNNDSIKLSGTSSTGTGQWSTSGSGAFSPNNTTLNATYVPSGADTAAGTVTLTLTTTGNGGCLAVTDQLVITITHAPTVNAGPDQSVCANNANVTLNGSFTVASGAMWSTSGSGTFTPNNTTMNAIYTPSGADTAAGFVNIVLTSTGNGSCKAVADTMKIIYTNAPTVEAGNNVKVCLSSPNYTLSGSSTTGKGTWVTLGSGTFVPNANTLGATYKPSTADTIAGSVILILTSTNNGGCSAVSDSIKITYTRTPTVNAGTNQTVCANNDNVSLSATSSTGTGTWTTSGTGIFSPNANTLNATYIPSNADTAAGTVTLTFTASGGCSPTAKSIVITITNAPYVNAGPDQSVCRNNANVTLSGVIGGATTTGVWSTSGSGTFSPSNTTLGATYIPSTADTTAGKVTLVLTSTGNGSCLAVTDTMVIIYTPIPKVNAGADITVCANNDSVKLSGTSTTSSGIWTTSGSGTFSPNANTLNATYIPSNADTAAGTVTLTLTSTSNGGCAAVTDKMVITIGHAPTANAGPDQSVCANNSNVTLSGAISNASGGQWSSLGSGTFSPNNTTLNGTYIPSAADTTAHSVTVVLTTTGNGLCKAVTDTMIITITPSPKVEAGANVSVCRTSPDVTLNGSSSTGSASWSTSGSGTFTPNNSTFNATYIPSTADTTAGSVTLILTSGSNGNCNAVTDTMKIIYSKRPSDNAGTPITVCANNDSVSLSGVSSTGSGIWTTSGTGIFSPNANTLGATYVPSNADTTAGSITLTLTTTNNGGCASAVSSVVVTITHAPTANAGPDQSICANATVSLSGTVSVASGGQWSTLGSGTFSPNNTTLNATYTPSAADTTAHTVTLVLSTTGNGQCEAATDTVVITINSGPVVNAGSDVSVCLSSPDYTLNGTSSTGSGVWTTLGSGTFTPNANTLNATYVPSTADTSAHTVTLILTSVNNGGCSASSDTMVITYTNVPSVNAGSNQTVCANNAVVTLNGTSGTGAGIWTTSGSGTFSPNATTLNATYTPSAADTTAHSVTLTLTATGGCSSASQSITITFTPAPFVNAGADQFACKNNPDVTLNGYVGGGSTTGAWTSLGSGTFTPNNTTLNANYIPSTADTTAGSVTLILTSTNNGTCLASADTMVITFTAPPVVNAGPDESACANNSVPLNGVITGGSGTGIWTTPNGAGIFSPNSTTLTGSYTPSNNDTVAKNIILVLTSTNNGTCNAASDTMIITVSPGPIVNAGPDQTVCANNDIVTLSGSITNAGGVIWSTLGSGTFSPNNTTLNATYIPNSADTAAKTVTIVLTSTGNGLCTSATDTMAITISPAPRVNAGSDIFICEGNTTASLNGSVSGGSSTGIWTTLGSGTFTPNDSALNATYNLSTADTTAKTVTLILTSTHNGSCVSSSDTVVIKVTPIASVYAGADTTVCANAGEIPLHGNVTGGSGTGIWSTLGSGTFNPNDSVLGASYTPSSVDTSAHSVTLVLSATGSCNPASDTVVITFTPAPKANAGADQTICAGSNVLLSGSVSLATGGKWSTTGNGTFTPNDSTLVVTYIPGSNDITAGGVNLILVTTGNGGCSASTDTMHVTIQSKPVANFTSSRACLNGTVNFRDTSTLTSGSIVSWSWNLGNTSSTIQDPTDTYASTGTQAITLIVSTSAGCSDTITKNIYVNPLPVAMFTYKTFCPDSVNFTDASTVVGETITAWNWKFGDSAKSSLQDPSHTYPTSATYTVTLIAISDSGCSASYMDTVTVNACNGTVSTAPGVPTAFTPNGDGTNDILYVRGGPFSQFDFRIFNEWGTQIFQSQTQSEGWDGTVHGTKQPAGTFTWTLVGTTVDGKAIKMTGNVTILR